MNSATPLPDLVAAARDPRGAGDLLRRLGFDPAAEVVPRVAWAAYGINGAGPVTALTVAGRAGSLDALLIEVRDAAGLEAAPAIARGVRARNPVRLHLFLFLAPAAGRLVLGTHGLDGGFRHLALETDRVRASDLEALEEMAARPGEAGLGLAMRQARALDRSRVTRMFFRDFSAQRRAVAGAFTGIPTAAAGERGQLALLFLSRLTFLYFLQRRGTLCGDDRYLVGLFGRWAPGEGEVRGTFYRARLAPLFFGALNRPAADRSEAARALGDLPYLNGGLFEPHPLEHRYPGLDLDDRTVRRVLEDLLERYRFTTREAGEGAGFGVDPEVLGRVFEELMAPDRRSDTGSFYTPARVVDRVVREAIATYVGGAHPDIDPDALLGDDPPPLAPAPRRRVRRSLERVRVLDPACGSGAFLLGALHHLARAIGATTDPGGPSHGEVRREVVARALHGVDLLDDAALLCSLRLWLALSGDDDQVRPLPNLDRRIRQGDALVDPLDLAGPAAGDPGWMDAGARQARRAVGPAGRRYLESSPDTRDTARAELARAERDLARHWLRRARSASDHEIRGLDAAARDRDLFGEPSDGARRARAALERARARAAELAALEGELDERGSFPFFSFAVHFADAGGGFDLIVSNPPWVRAHRWPDRLRRTAARHYEVCGAAGWPGAAPLTGAPAGGGAQIDLSLLFLEKACRLLAPGGVLALLVPAKAMRALYGGAARRIALRDLEFALIEDHALDHRSIFRADAFAAVLIARKRAVGTSSSSAAVSGPETRVRMVRRGVAPLEFRVRQRDLPLFPDDPASPWVLAPPDALGALRAMQAAGAPLGLDPGLRIRRGVMTGANDVLVLSRVEPRLGGLSRVEATGYAAARRRGRPAREAGRFRGHVETSAIRPLVRGAGIDAFRYEAAGGVVWCHGPDGSPVSPPPRMERYLARHRAALEARPGWRPGLPLGTVFRLGSDTLGPKVAWHDLSDTLKAVVLPAAVPFDGALRELVPLNTVYFLPAGDDDAPVLAGLLNSLPVRTFARAIAERAKDARFRFFAWTVASLPLPAAWQGSGPAAAELRRLSRRGHDRGGLEPDEQARLDRAAAALYGLEDHQLEALMRFDAWLRGAT